MQGLAMVVGNNALLGALVALLLGLAAIVAVPASAQPWPLAPQSPRPRTRARAGGGTHGGSS